MIRPAGALIVIDELVFSAMQRLLVGPGRADADRTQAGAGREPQTVCRCSTGGRASGRTRLAPTERPDEP